LKQTLAGAVSVAIMSSKQGENPDRD